MAEHGVRRAVQQFGISLDEAQRMRDSDVKYLTNAYPLVDRRMTRTDCLAWLARHGYPTPPKSACIGCPYHDARAWRAMKRTRPEEFADAVAFDEAMRDRSGTFDGEVFLHRQRIPLRLVDLSTREERGQLPLFADECQGVCGV